MMHHLIGWSDSSNQTPYKPPSTSALITKTSHVTKAFSNEPQYGGYKGKNNDIHINKYSVNILDMINRSQNQSPIQAKTKVSGDQHTLSYYRTSLVAVSKLSPLYLSHSMSP
jgi:bisphosphoglycerate-dependent phosphoglycerate mutase